MFDEKHPARVNEAVLIEILTRQNLLAGLLNVENGDTQFGSVQCLAQLRAMGDDTKTLVAAYQDKIKQLKDQLTK